MKVENGELKIIPFDRLTGCEREQQTTDNRQQKVGAIVPLCGYFSPKNGFYGENYPFSGLFTGVFRMR